MAKIPARAHKILMIDANSRMHHFDDSNCGSHGSNPQDNHEDCSDLFHQALVENGMWLPATFAATHEGDHSTWSIGGRPGSRLDYVAIPDSWRTGTCQSKVNEDFRSGISLHDHKATQLTCSLDLEGSMDMFHHRIPLDRPAMTTPEGQETCREIFANMPRLPATTDPTIHCHVAEQYLQTELHKHFKLNRRKCKKQHISQASYDLVLSHRAVRRQLRACYQWKDRTWLSLCFQNWAKAAGQEPTGFIHDPELFERTLRHIEHQCASLSMRHSDTHRQLRQSLVADRRIRDEALCETIARAPLHSIWEALKPLLPKHRRGIHSAEHLPGLRDSQGLMATSPAEVAHILQDHFAAAEGGSQHPPDVAVAMFFETQQNLCGPFLHGDMQVSLENIPTLQSLEEKFRRIKTGKACGLDGLPGECFAPRPRQQQRHTMGLCPKCAYLEPTPCSGEVA